MRSILVGTALRLKINGGILLDTWDGEGIEKLGVAYQKKKSELA